MPGRTYVFDRPDRFVAGAVGEPGHRSFFLQAAKGRAVVTVALEKIQVALLSERIGVLARENAETDPGEEPGRLGGEALPAALVLEPARGLQEPIVEAFRVGSMTLTYDEEGRNVTVEAQEVAGASLADVVTSRAAASARSEGSGARDDEDDDPDLDVLRVRLPLDDAVRFAEGALRVVAAGRPPCPLCGEPLDPQGHICVRRNGYVM